MPRKRTRKENAGLPARWRVRHGAYYYDVPAHLRELWDGKREFRLGKTLTEAYRTWTDRLEHQTEARTIGDLLDRYALEVVPKKAPKTQDSNYASITKLKAVFGHMPINRLEPQHAYQYIDKRTAKTSAIREYEVLSHAYTKAVQWGLIKTHPLKGQVVKERPEPRKRYVEDAELIEALKVASDMLRAYIGLKLLTGLRRGDLLRLRVSDLKEDGIHVHTRKTDRPVIYEWTDALREAVKVAKAARPKDIAPWLFCTRKGEPYIKEDGSANAFDSLWQRFMRRVLEKTKVTERFTEHDLRAKCASDAESLERARELLAHADAATTRRVYRRKAERVRPAK